MHNLPTFSCKNLFETSFGWGTIPMMMAVERPLTFILAVAVNCFSHKNAVDFVVSKLAVDKKTAKVLLTAHCWGAGEASKRDTYKALVGKDFVVSNITVNEVMRLAFTEE
ncbi:hypothetical protein HWC59_gp78 [Proteus phage Myduc]|uniref:Uncharacterized protein n=1 Tax=Proteus phage Myduc TaxID=2650874 RepID=A0A5J6TDR8_9CAUD|nr:hypothetical protein HWC59_gp78 [Proteus phage Myduc]QFG06659.1 hypothetical protein CPT_Myduc_037 [Proteus phage Myduc]